MKDRVYIANWRDVVRVRGTLSGLLTSDVVLWEDYMLSAAETAHIPLSGDYPDPWKEADAYVGRVGHTPSTVLVSTCMYVYD